MCDTVPLPIPWSYCIVVLTNDVQPSQQEQKTIMIESYFVKKIFKDSKNKQYTVWKMDLILRSMQRGPQMQFSMGRKFTLWRYSDMT